MTLPASIRVNCRSPFPSRVSAGPGIAVAKANGIWTVGLNYPALAAAASLLATHEWAVFDTVAGTYSLISPALLAAYVLSGNRVAVNDAAYAAAVSDGLIAYTALSAPRIVSLPAAGGYAAGAQVQVVIESGTGSAVNTVTVAANGTDTINGNATAVITGAYGRLKIETDGVSKWTILERDLTSQIAALPTALPATAGVMWNNGGIPCIS
jgi:hypothetical protein